MSLPFFEGSSSLLELKTSFVAFRQDAMWLRHCYNMYHSLYESGSENDGLLRASAEVFFYNLSNILVEYIILQIAKLTDPATSKVQGITRDNLTVAHLNAELKKNKLMSPEICSISKKLMQYRNLIVSVRNKLIAHSDKATRLDGNPIGVHTPEEVSRFFSDLQKYCDTVGKQIGADPSDFSVQAGQGDVSDLLSALKRSNKALGES